MPSPPGAAAGGGDAALAGRLDPAELAEGRRPPSRSEVREDPEPLEGADASPAGAPRRTPCRAGRRAARGPSRRVRGPPRRRSRRRAPQGRPPPPPRRGAARLMVRRARVAPRTEEPPRARPGSRAAAARCMRDSPSRATLAAAPGAREGERASGPPRGRAGARWRGAGARGSPRGSAAAPRRRRSFPEEVRGRVPGGRTRTVCGAMPVRSRTARRAAASDRGVVPAERRGARSARTRRASPSAPLGHDAGGDGAARAQTRDTGEGRLELLGRVVRAADDHDVLRPAVHVELPVRHEPEVPGVEPALRVERPRRRSRVPEVLAHERRAPHEDPAEAPGSRGTASRRRAPPPPPRGAGRPTGTTSRLPAPPRRPGRGGRDRAGAPRAEAPGAGT
jgi:hypothetical protein